MTKYKTPRWGWAITGSGHFLKETLALVRELEDVDLFLSKAAAEVLRMYKQELGLQRSIRVYRDTTASSCADRAILLWRLSQPDRRPRNLERRREIRLRHFRRSRQQCVRAGRQMPRSGDRLRLRYRAGTGDRGAERHGEGLPAPDRPRELANASGVSRAPTTVEFDRRASRGDRTTRAPKFRHDRERSCS